MEAMFPETKVPRAKNLVARIIENRNEHRAAFTASRRKLGTLRTIFDLFIHPRKACTELCQQAGRKLM